VAKLLSRNGVGCVCSFISPYQEVRDQVRAETTNFLEVFIDAPLAVVIDRDVKGMYKKAIAGEIPNFTGISDPFEAPENPDIHIRTDQESPEESAQTILDVLVARGLI
jgi:adenylylsulfate kinase-like enzyme